MFHYAPNEVAKRNILFAAGRPTSLPPTRKTHQACVIISPMPPLPIKIYCIVGSSKIEATVTQWSTTVPMINDTIMLNSVEDEKLRKNAGIDGWKHWKFLHNSLPLASQSVAHIEQLNDANVTFRLS